MTSTKLQTKSESTKQMESETNLNDANSRTERAGIFRARQKYDLEDRTLKFASQVREFVKILPKSTANLEDTKQLVRSSGSVGANYIEANESLSKKDFVLRIKICKKEAKESRYWLTLIDDAGKPEVDLQREVFVREATELIKIFAAILSKCDIGNSKFQALNSKQVK